MSPYVTYVPLVVKTLDVAARRITGVASTNNLDRHGDRIEPAGLTFAASVPLLVEHRPDLPVGRVTFALAAPNVLTFEATFARVDAPGILKDRIDTAWESVRAGLYTAVSVGLARVGAVVEALKGGGLHFKRAELVELSLVTVGANPDASILAFKALDAPYLLPAAPAARPSAALAAHPRSTMTHEHVTDTIQKWTTQRENAAGRMATLLEQSQTDATILDPDAQTEFDGLQKQVDEIDGQLSRYKVLETINKAAAVPITKAAGVPVDGRSRITVRPNLEPGTAFVRYGMALLATKGSKLEAIEYAKQWKDSTPEVEMVLRAAVAAGNTTDATWAGPLAQLNNMASEFLALMRPATIIGKIPGLTRVPFNTRMAAQTGGGTYGWVGEGLAKPVTKLAFGSVTLGITKAAGIVVFTEELARTSTPSAEAIVRRDMIDGIAAFLDAQFVDPAVAEVAGVHPASITNGAATSASSNKFGTDLQTMLNTMKAGGVSPKAPVVLMSENNAFALAAITQAGITLYPSITMQGGTVMGITIVTSSVLGSNVVLLDPSSILYADDGGVTLDVSREASVQMDNAPVTPGDATTVYTSLWQNNYIGLRAERFINWKRARSAGVQYVTAATYTIP